MENNNQTIPQNKTYPLFFWGICIILFLPIIVVPPTFQPSDWTRFILLRIILTLLISFFLFKFFYKKEYSISIPDKKNLAFIPFLLLSSFLAVLILSTIFSQDIRFSIFGSPTRAGGLLNLLFLFLFIIILALFVKEDGWEKLQKANIISGLLASFLAFIQYFRLFGGLFLSYEGGGVPSSLGNSTFLAVYMLFLGFWNFVLFFLEKNRRKKIFYAGLSVLFFLTMAITGSRASYLGALMGFFFFFFFYPKKFKILKTFAASLLVITVLIIALFNLFPQLAEKNIFLKTIAPRLSIKTAAKDLVGTRFAAWEITFEAIKDKPILGWGPENFYIGFEKHYDPTLPSMQRLWWDRPHNLFLEIWVNSGIFALILYMAFWTMLFWQLQIYKRRLGENRNTYLAHGLQTMFIGYLVVMFFNFNSFATLLISSLFIGYAFYLICEQGKKIIILPPKTNLLRNKFIVILFLALMFLFLWPLNIKPLYLNERIVFIQNLVNAKKCEQAINMIDKSWKNSGILQAYAGIRYAALIKSCAPSQPEKEVEYSTKALEILKVSSKMQPKFTRTWLIMGAFTNVLAAKETNAEKKNALLSEAKGYLEKSLQLSPKRQDIFWELEKNYLLEENFQAMKELAQKCAEIDQSDGVCYWYWGIAEIFSGDQDSGKKHIEEAEEKFSGAFPYIQLGVAYMSQKNYEGAAEAYELVVKYEPNNASYHAVLAFLYKEIGRYADASREALTVFRLQPENKEVEKFLKILLQLDINDPTVHASLAYFYKQTGQNEKARQEYLITETFYSQAVIQYPKNAGFHFRLANVYKELDEYEEAYKEALLAEKLDSKSFHDLTMNLILSLPENYWKRYQQAGNQ